MRNLVLLGLQDSGNLGDTLVCACTERIIEGILRKLGIGDVGLVSCDMYGAECYAALDAFAARKEELTQDEIRRLRKETVVSSARERARSVISDDTAAVIFFGGGIIKYGHSLKLGYCMEPYLRRAEERNVPVMISAAGVDGYDPGDEECGVFAEILNLPCVRTITVRDDIDLLKKAYVSSPEIRVRKVPCPTLLCSELFPAERRRETGVIGLGVIKPKKMTEIHPEFTAEKQIALWTGIIGELEKRGFGWRLFSNGLQSDFRFIPEILNAAGRPASAETMLPGPRNVRELLDSYLMFDGIVASRFHVAVPSYSYGIPFVELVWNVKQTLFAKDMHLEDSFFNPETATAAQIVDRLSENMRKPRPQTPVDPRRTVNELERFLREVL